MQTIILCNLMQASPLMQADAYVRDVEQAYTGIYADFTLSECARALKEAGAARVEVLVVASDKE